nr:c111.2 [Tranosema rostrale ichnovirus]
MVVFPILRTEYCSAHGSPPSSLCHRKPQQSGIKKIQLLLLPVRDNSTFGTVHGHSLFVKSACQQGVFVIVVSEKSLPPGWKCSPGLLGRRIKLDSHHNLWRSARQVTKSCRGVNNAR